MPTKPEQFDCWMCVRCDGLEKEGDIPGAPISDSTQRSKKQRSVVAPPG